MDTNAQTSSADTLSADTLSISAPSPGQQPAAALRGTCGGDVVLPDDPRYDEARVPWSAAVSLRPAAIVYPRSAQDVVDVVRAAAGARLRVTAQGTGHNARPLPDLSDVVLVKTSQMNEVTIDAERRIARVEAGALWIDVVQAATEHGLTALHGSSPDVGVVGYSLGGGLGWYARAFGLQCNAITAVELVTADGSQRRVDAANDAELFWALRGGGGNFGIVTALEFGLLPIDSVYGGMLVWDRAQAEPVLRRWLEWTTNAPDSVTTSFRILQLPPMPELPEPLRGRSLAVIDGASLGSDDEASELLAPLRALSPEIDTFARVPAASLVRMHMDPEGPTPSASDSALLQVDAEAHERLIAAVLDVAGPTSGTSLLVAAELRQLGGALSRPAPDAGALPVLPGNLLAFAVGIAATPELAALATKDSARTIAALEPWTCEQEYLNYRERATDARRGYEPAAAARLSALRAKVDPDGLFVANHPLPIGKEHAAL
jgi:FAD/FMN-containing dehydrogenase